MAGWKPVLQPQKRTMNSILHTAKLFVFVLAGWLLTASFLFAKEGTTSEGASGEGSWVFAYFLTGLGVVLGMLVVCRSSSRRERVKPEAYAKGQAKEE
jgi:hypothetical protein